MDRRDRPQRPRVVRGADPGASPRVVRGKLELPTAPGGRGGDGREQPGGEGAGGDAPEPRAEQSGAGDAGPAPPSRSGPTPEGRLAELAARLEELEEVPLSEHPDLFEELDALLAEELSSLDGV